MTTSVVALSKRGWLWLFNPISIARHLWAQRGLIVQMTRREIGQRYRGSLLGVAWSLIVPLCTLAIYTFVFSGIFQSRWRVGSDSLGEYALTLFAGLTAYNVFAEVTTRAPTLVLANPNLVKKVVFPLEILPVVQLGASLFNCLVSISLLLIANLALMGTISVSLWLVPLAFVPLVLLVLGAAWFLAALGVYVRDIAQAIGIAVQLVLFISPVMYPLTAVPEVYRGWFVLNPLTTILNGFRETLLWGQPLDWAAWASVSALMALVAIAGFAWFCKAKNGFADVM